MFHELVLRPGQQDWRSQCLNHALYYRGIVIVRVCYSSEAESKWPYTTTVARPYHRLSRHPTTTVARPYHDCRATPPRLSRDPTTTVARPYHDCRARNCRAVLSNDLISNIHNSVELQGNIECKSEVARSLSLPSAGFRSLQYIAWICIVFII